MRSACSVAGSGAFMMLGMSAGEHPERPNATAATPTASRSRRRTSDEGAGLLGVRLTGQTVAQGPGGRARRVAPRRVPASGHPEGPTEGPPEGPLLEWARQA